MRLTAEDLYDLNIIDKIIKEPQGEEDESFSKTANSLKKEIKKSINEMKKLSSEEIVQNRYEKFRNVGELRRKEDVIKE